MFFVLFQRRVVGFRKVHLHIHDKTQVLQPCLLPLLSFPQLKRDGSGSSCYPLRVKLSSFVSLLAERWGGGRGGGEGGVRWWTAGIRRIPAQNWRRCWKRDEGKKKKKNSSWFPDYFPECSARYILFPLLGGVPGLQCTLFANTCIKNQQDGNTRFRDLPLASPYTTSRSEVESGPPCSGARTPYSPETVLAQLPPPRAENSWKLWCAPTAPRATLPVISARQGSKCAFLQPLAGSQLGNSVSLSCPCSCGEKLQTWVHTYTFTRPSFFTQENQQ